MDLIYTEDEMKTSEGVNLKKRVNHWVELYIRGEIPTEVFLTRVFEEAERYDA